MPSCCTCRVTSPSIAATLPTTSTRAGAILRSTRRTRSSSASGGESSSGASSAAASPAPSSAACQSMSGVRGIAPTSTTVSTSSATVDSAMTADVAWTVPASSRSTANPRSSTAATTPWPTCSGDPTTVTVEASSRVSSACTSSGRRSLSVRRTGRPLAAARWVPRIIVAGWLPGTRTTSSAVANAYCIVFTAVSNRLSPTMRVTETTSCFSATAGTAIAPSTATMASRTPSTEPAGRITASERTRRP